MVQTQGQGYCFTWLYARTIATSLNNAKYVSCVVYYRIQPCKNEGKLDEADDQTLASIALTPIGTHKE